MTVSDSTTTTTWEDISKAKRATRDAAIPREWRLKTIPPVGSNVLNVPRECGLLNERELKITETPADQLVAAMIKRTYDAEEVTRAFCKRAALAQQLTNCLTEIFFEAGIAYAQELDDEYQKTGKPRGPLHGLPISLKDSIGLVGLDSTVGFISHCNQPCKPEDEADIVSILRAAGAVFYCKTNVPTGMLMGDSYNNVWGAVTNPYNTAYGAGGSSGGESALLALRGSPLGVGSDIGGSIRMPAAITGIFGIKSAAGRFPNLGCKSGLPGQEAVKGVQGPMAADLAALELWSKVVINSKPWERDPGVYPVEWKDDVKIPEKLCFGIMYDDQTCRPTPAVTRALKETAAALEAAGHKVIEFTPYDPPAGIALLIRCLTGDGGAKIYSQIRGGQYPEPWPQDLDIFEARYEATKNAPPTVGQLWELQYERNGYLRKLLKSWADTADRTGTGRPIDALICPAVAEPAAPSYKFRYFGYTGLWNLADHTGTVFPATTARKTDVKPEGIEFRNEHEKFVWDNYDADKLDGMPVGLQLITPRHTEELSLKLTGIVYDALQKEK